MTEYNTIKHANGDFHQPNTIKIEMDIEDYIYLLDNRRNFVENHYNWHIPDCLWEYFCECIKDTGVYGNNRPDIVVDNAIINGDWGDFDDYKQKFETDEDFIKRVEDNVFYINKDERVVCFSI